MKYRVLAFATLFAILGTSTTFATPVTVNPDENVFFNFDLTGLSPGPVYDEIVIYTKITNIRWWRRAVVRPASVLCRRRQ
jgi:hypothetical protein